MGTALPEGMGMRSLLAALGLLLVLFASGCIFSCNNRSAPPLDTCSNAAPASVDRLELADAYKMLVGEDFPAPLAAGGAVRLVRGVQGADMIVLRLGLHGSQIPDCIDIQVVVTTASGKDVSAAHAALRIYSGTGGSDPSRAVTKDIYLPGSYDDPKIVVTVTAGGSTLRLPLQVRTMGCPELDSCVTSCSGDPSCAQACAARQDATALALFTTLNQCLQRTCGRPRAADAGSGDLGPGGDGGFSDGGFSDGGFSDGGFSDGGLSDGGLSDGGADLAASSGLFSCTDSFCFECVSNVTTSVESCSFFTTPSCGLCGSEAAACFND